MDTGGPQLSQVRGAANRRGGRAGLDLRPLRGGVKEYTMPTDAEIDNTALLFAYKEAVKARMEKTREA